MADTAGVTLARYLLSEQAVQSDAEPEFWTLIARMAYVAKVIARETRRAALVERLGWSASAIPLATSRRRSMCLRILYEGAPLALVVETAGGCASTGCGRTVDIAPTSLHQRVSVALGSREDVRMCEQFAAGQDP